MGKAAIVSEYGQGRYLIELEYNRVLVETQKTAAQASIDRIQALIDPLDPIDDAEEIAVLEVEKLSYTKKLAQLTNDVPEDYTLDAWCADRTGGITGDVGTIEINGETGEVLIQPGYLGASAYDDDRDAQLFPTLGGMTPLQAFFNFAILPGWQKWQPTFRTGVITWISGDLADVELDAALSAQQGININKFDTLDNVPIDYMSCNGSVFEVGDEVVVRFINQDWTQPQIIGFRTEPESCAMALLVVRGDAEEYIDIALQGSTEFQDGESVTCDDGGSGTISKATTTRVYGSFTLCWSGTLTGVSSGAVANIIAAYSDYFERIYSAREIFPASVEDFPTFLEIVGPFDKYPMSMKPSEDAPVTGDYWSKTYDEVTIAAFIHWPSGVGSPEQERWSVSVSYYNDIISWDPFAGDYFPSGGYQRKVCPVSGGCEFENEYVSTHIGFDIWKEGDEFFVGVISDQNETLRVFQVNKLTLKMDYIGAWQSAYRGYLIDEEIDEFAYEHVRLIGYGHIGDDDIAYWCSLGRGYTYIRENLRTGARTETDLGDYTSAHPGYINDALWNPIERAPYFQTESDGGVAGDPVSDEEIEGYQVSFIRVGQAIYYNFDGSLISDGSEECPPSLSFDMSLKTTPGGHDIMCTNRPVSPVSPWVCNLDNKTISTSSWVWTESGWTYNRGVFSVDGSAHDKGEYDSFSKSFKLLRWYILQGDDSCSAALYDQISAGSKDGWCRPSGAVDYELTGWVFAPGGHAYEYREINLIETVDCDQLGVSQEAYQRTSCARECTTTNEYCDGDVYCYDQFPGETDCDCDEYAWAYNSVGSSDVLDAIDANFPHDSYWRAILLHGWGRASAEDPARVEHAGYIIYENADTGSLFLIDDGGVYYSIGSYQRTWFKSMGVE